MSDYKREHLPQLLRDQVVTVLRCEAEPHVIADAQRIVEQAADAIEALSPLGVGEDEVELHDQRVIELAGVLFKAEHPNSEWSPGRAAPCWFFRAQTAINALTSARAQC